MATIKTQFVPVELDMLSADMRSRDVGRSLSSVCSLIRLDTILDQ